MSTGARASQHRRSSRIILTLVLLIPALVHVFPILYMVSISLKTGSEIFRLPPTLLPEAWQLSNYIEALRSAPLLRFIFNSLVAAGLITVLQLLTSILAAYALARMKFRGQGIVLGVMLATMMIPGEVTMIPNYLTVAKLGLLDSFVGLIAPFAASGFGVFLLYQFFRQITVELEEAARLDGASRLRFLFQFMVPMSMPALIAFGVYAFVSAWNQYLWPLIVTQSQDMRTVQIGIGMFRSENESSSWGVIMAATTMLVLPGIMLFVATQKHFVRGLTMGGSKS